MKRFSILIDDGLTVASAIDVHYGGLAQARAATLETAGSIAVDRYLTDQAPQQVTCEIHSRDAGETVTLVLQLDVKELPSVQPVCATATTLR